MLWPRCTCNNSVSLNRQDLPAINFQNKGAYLIMLADATVLQLGGGRHMRRDEAAEAQWCLLRQLGLPLRGVWALTSSELPWAVPDGQT
jgi:hypothetical protein